MRYFVLTLAILGGGAGLVMQSYAQSSFAPVWRTVPWDSGGLHPSSIAWSMMKSELDLDNDGKKEFLLSTAWSGVYHNAVYLYEYASNNNYQNVWSYSFYPYSNDYSAVAVADLDGDGWKEILCLIDPYDSTYHGFYVFEWNGMDNGFPALPTATWNLNLPAAFDEGTAIIAGDFDNDGREEVAVAIQERYSTPKSRFMVFSLAPGSTFQNPVWNIEFQDSTTFAYVGYALEATDLDRDGRKEIVAAGWEPLHLAFYEHTGSPDSFARVANVYHNDLTIDLSNMGFAEANYDNNATCELYIATANGRVYVVTNPGDVGQMTGNDIILLHAYDPYRGIAGVSRGDIDLNGVPELYLAGSYHEAVFQWKYAGGSITDPQNYHRTTVYQDDTTDNITPGSDQGWFRPSKVAVGDFDNDGRPDMAIASASFARDKPILTVIEMAPANVRLVDQQVLGFMLEQNFPNPFNPSTQIWFRIPEVGHAVLKMYDMLGREVAELVNETLQPGRYSIRWDASGMPSGVYYARLSAGGFTETKRMTLIK
ncbi:MAG: T9SS type A sorting domain-containing protein [Bacteroidetes bacterium]|nr:T9SS type A sorting domain-containing protein [Bacteroidota bacterium]MCW5895681.1 T9SS type A sorting domain-containing protein [Bacteroidota bacterium]